MSLIGPPLPPGLGKQPEVEDRKPETDDETTVSPDEEEEGTHGPVLPPKVQKKLPDEEQEQDAYGPSLPPGFSASNSSCDASAKPVLGPTLPPNFQSFDAYTEGADESSSSENGDDFVIGPMPPCLDQSSSEANYLHEIERRSQSMKDKLLNKDSGKKLVRETWMLELPAERAKRFGLGPRTFSRRSEAPKDSSLWTETPSEREKREKGGPSKPSCPDLLAKGEAERDAFLDEAMEDHKKKQRKESLLDLHQKERKRKLAEEGTKPNERRPFDRDIDLQVNRFDEAQREAVIKKSRKLNNRFSVGQQKYL